MTPVPNSKRPKDRIQPYPPRNVNRSSQGDNGMPQGHTPCLLCGQSYLNTMKTIKNHLKRIHIRSRKWECDRCGLRFGVLYELNRHRDKVECEKSLHGLPPPTAADKQIIAHHERVDKCKTIEELEGALFFDDPHRCIRIRYDYKQNINQLGLELPDEPQEYGGAMPPLGGINVGYSGMSALESMGFYNSPTTTTQSSPDSEEGPYTSEPTGPDHSYPYQYEDAFWEKHLGPLDSTRGLGYNN